MLLKHLFIVAGLLAAIWGGILLYNFFFTSQSALDIRLAEEIMEDVTANPDIFHDKILSIEVIEPTIYVVEMEGVTDAQEAGKIGYNCMASLINNNVILQTTHHNFTVKGYQDGELIFNVFSTATAHEAPTVTLHGPFEGIEYIPSFGRVIPIRNETFSPVITSHA